MKKVSPTLREKTSIPLLLPAKQEKGEGDRPARRVGKGFPKLATVSTEDHEDPGYTKCEKGAGAVGSDGKTGEEGHSNSS